jgi:hypothetical protein
MFFSRVPSGLVDFLTEEDGETIHLKDLIPQVRLLRLQPPIRHGERTEVDCMRRIDHQTFRKLLLAVSSSGEAWEVSACKHGALADESRSFSFERKTTCFIADVYTIPDRT